MGGSHAAEAEGRFSVSSFRSGLHVEMNVSIASRRSTSTTVDGGGGGGGGYSLISPPRSHQACFITREVKLSDCVAATVIFFFFSAFINRPRDLIGAREPLACVGLFAYSTEYS